MKSIGSKEFDCKKNSKQYIGEARSKDQALLYYNLIWLTTKEAAVYLRKSVNAIHTLVSRGKIRARKFSNRLYFKREELDYLLETSLLVGGV